MVSLSAPYFSTLSHKEQNVKKKGIEHKVCVLIFFTTFARTISHFKKNSAKYCHKYKNIIKHQFSQQTFKMHRFVFNYIFPKPSRLWDNVEKCGGINGDCRWQYGGALHAGLVRLHPRKHTPAPVHPHPHTFRNAHARTSKQTPKHVILNTMFS